MVKKRVYKVFRSYGAEEVELHNEFAYYDNQGQRHVIRLDQGSAEWVELGCPTIRVGKPREGHHQFLNYLTVMVAGTTRAATEEIANEVAEFIRRSELTYSIENNLPASFDLLKRFKKANKWMFSQEIDWENIQGKALIRY